MFHLTVFFSLLLLLLYLARLVSVGEKMLLYLNFCFPESLKLSKRNKSCVITEDGVWSTMLLSESITLSIFFKYSKELKKACKKILRMSNAENMKILAGDLRLTFCFHFNVTKNRVYVKCIEINRNLYWHLKELK